MMYLLYAGNYSVIDGFCYLCIIIIIPMNRFVFKFLLAPSASVLMLLSSVSCINQEYEISEDKIDLDVNLFQEGVAIPLGSTSEIKVDDLLSQLDDEYKEYFETMADGTYSVSMSDEFDLSDSLDILKETIEIEDVAMTQAFEFSLSDVDVSGVKIDPVDLVFEKKLSESVTLPSFSDITIDGVYSYGSGLYEYALRPEDTKVDMEPLESDCRIVSLPSGFEMPQPLINDKPISISAGVSIPGIEMDIISSFDEEVDIDLRVPIPDGIRSIKDIALDKNAKVRITVEMRQSLLVSGKIYPEMDIDLSDIFEVRGADTGHIITDFAIPAEGGTVSAEYGIKSIIFNEDEWNSDQGYLKLDKSVKISLAPRFDKVTTTTEHIAECGYKETILDVKVEFVDFAIDNVTAEIDPISVDVNQEHVFDIAPITLPEGVRSIKNVSFADNSRMTLSLSAENLDKIDGLGLKIKTLELSLPEGMIVDGASGGKLVYSDVDLKEGFQEEIYIDGFTLPEPVDKVIALDGRFGVKAVAVAEGIISTDDIPVSESDDLKLKIDVEGKMEIADYSATIDGYSYPLEISQHFEEEVPETLQDMGEVVVYPEGNPAIRIDVNLPETALPVKPLGDGIKIMFPQMLKLKDVPSEYNYDEERNVIVFKDVIPERIELPIDHIVLAPVMVDGKCCISGDMSVSGTVGVDAGVINKQDVENLASAEVSIKAHVPELVPSKFALDQYTSTIEQDFEVNLIEPGLIPEEIVSVGRIELEDVYAEICLDASSLPSIGNAGFELDLTIDFPEILVLGEGLRDESGLIHIRGGLDDDGMIRIDPIKIEALDLSDVDLRSEDALSGTVKVNGSVRLTDAELDLDEWMGKNHSVTFEASISDIKISRITGKVDYSIDPVSRTIDLSQIRSSLKTDNIETVVDLAHVHLAVDLETNLAISALAKAELIPYYGNEPSTPISVDLEIDAARSSGEVKKTRYWLGNNEECCKEGYEFVKIPILELIRNIPDSIMVMLEAGTDAQEDIVLEPGADYVLKAAYAFDIPLTLGEDFRLEFRDTLSDIPSVVSTIFRGGNLVLTGEVESALPLELELNARLLDNNGRVIELAEDSGKQVISGCDLDGSAVKTDLNLKMAKKEGSDLPDISAVELHFVARSAGYGAPLKKDAYVKAALQALVPDGVHVDLRDIINENEEEEE